MSTLAPGGVGYGNDGHTRRSFEELAVAEDEEAWRARTRVFLTPVAAPSIMGLFGFMIATLMLGAWQAGWYGGGPRTALTLFPFAFMAGGVMQAVAAVVSFRARDSVAVAAHTAWGSFWMAWGLMQLLVALHVMPPLLFGAENQAFGFWFIGLTGVTGICTIGALAQSGLLTITLGALTGGSALTAVGFLAGSLIVDKIGGWFFVVSAGAALVTAGAMVLEGAYGRTIIPLGKWSREANVPGRRATRPLAYPQGMPGVRVGQ